MDYDVDIFGECMDKLGTALDLVYEEAREDEGIIFNITSFESPAIALSGPSLEALSETAGLLAHLGVTLDDKKDGFGSRMTTVLANWDGDAANAAKTYQGTLLDCMNMTCDRARALADGLVKYGSVISAARDQFHNLTNAYADALVKKHNADETTESNAVIGGIALALGVAFSVATAGTSMAMASSALTAMSGGYALTVQTNNTTNISGTTYEDLTRVYADGYDRVINELRETLTDDIAVIFQHELAEIMKGLPPHLADDLEDRKRFYPQGDRQSGSGRRSAAVTESEPAGGDNSSLIERSLSPNVG